MKCLFLFLDGVGLGEANAHTNPLARANLPHIQNLLEGRRLLASAAPFHGQRASLQALDANLGVSGLPQSATGQAALLTGINVSARLGHHYGPKPNPAVAEFLCNGSLFSKLNQAGKRIAMLNAYPPRYFETIRSGRRMYSAIPLAATQAGIALRTIEDLQAGRAFSVDFTARGWHNELGLTDVPILEPHQAGRLLAERSLEHDLSFFEFWVSDVLGHKQDMDGACQMLETFDAVMGGLLEAWPDEQGLILVTSDHGNLEDLSVHRHTASPVPALLIGAAAERQRFCQQLHDLTDITPAILNLLGVS